MQWECKKCGAIEDDFDEVILTCPFCTKEKEYDLDEACKSFDALCASRGVDLSFKNALINLNQGL